MVRDVPGIEPQASLLQAEIQMKKWRVQWLPVFEGGRVIGGVTCGALARRREQEGVDPVETHVLEVMSEIECFCNAEDDLDAAESLMRERELNHLMVIDDDHSFVGVLQRGAEGSEAGGYTIYG
jgi:predicted transcriptional regulator